MMLTLVRHGLAMEREEFLPQRKDDSLRPLLLKGKKRSLVMARQLKPWIDPVDILVTSPYLRAVQTAEIFRRVLRPQKVLQSVELIPSAPPMAFCQWLREHAGSATCVVVVGHEPQLGLLATWALAGQMDSFIELRKSGVLGLNVESFQDMHPAHAELKFLVTPKML